MKLKKNKKFDHSSPNKIKKIYRKCTTSNYLITKKRGDINKHWIHNNQVNSAAWLLVVIKKRQTFMIYQSDGKVDISRSAVDCIEENCNAFIIYYMEWWIIFQSMAKTLAKYAVRCDNWCADTVIWSVEAFRQKLNFNSF